MKIKTNLRSCDATYPAGFYRQAEENVSLCNSSVNSVLKDCGLPILPGVSVEATDKNPRKKYWRTVTVYPKTTDICVLGKKFDIHTRLQHFLEGYGWFNDGQKLWVKFTPYE
jgi:hypothetical protein